MNKAIPEIKKYMTSMPHSIGSDQTLDIANSLMKEHQIRHLPVLTAGKITGMISDRDLKLALSIRGVVATRTKVEDIATSDVFFVKPDSRLDDVVKTMSEKKIGSAVVVDNHHLVGIFTTTDALNALDELLQTRLTH